MQFSTGHAGIPVASCTAINASTDGLTLSGVTITAGKIYTVFLTKFTLALPVEVEEQTTYYLRISSSVIKIYTTLANAQAQTSPINFATTASGTLFFVYFPVSTYPALTCWEIGAATIADIVCCPPVPDVFTDCPNQAEVDYKGETRLLLNFTNYDFQGALNTIEFVAGEFNDGNGHTYNLNAKIGFYFLDFDYPPSETLPIAEAQIILSGGYGTNFGEQISGIANYRVMGNFSKNLTLNLIDNTFSSYYSELVAQGFLPSTLTFSLSGLTTPPPQIKVYMPDAYFENKDAPITLGLVEETLTYDAATLTYWSDLKTLAGIKGRLHFAIPNFYPLTSSNIKWIDSGFGYLYSLLNTSSVLYPLGSFPSKMLNTYSNDEFTFYPTLSFEHVPVYELFGQINTFRLFTACDEYDGYPTGLALGETWFDSRRIRNISSASPNYTGPTFVSRTNQKIVIAFSKWASGKFLKSNALGSELGESPGDLNHYHQSAYFVQSDDAGAYVSSLEV